MAYEYQTGEDTAIPGLGAKGEVLPEELSNRYFQALDQALARQERTQMERTLGELEGRGFLRSGDTFTRVAEDVLGPAQERRAQIILPEMQRAAGAGREERLGEVQFGRQSQLSRQEYLQRLDELEKQAQIKRMLMELEAQLSNDEDENMWGKLAGEATGIFAGQLAGRAGGWAGSKLFGSPASNLIQVKNRG